MKNVRSEMHTNATEMVETTIVKLPRLLDLCNKPIQKIVTKRSSTV